MKRLLLALLSATLVAAIGATSAGAGKPKPDKGTVVIVTASCPSPAKQMVYKGNVIVYVSGRGCVSVDDGASVIASGNAVIAAHGNASVSARDHVTLFIYDTTVSCSLKGKGVTWINSTKWVDSILKCRKP